MTVQIIDINSTPHRASQWHIYVFLYLFIPDARSVKIGGHLSLSLLLRLAKVKLKFLVCVFISWFICSFKSGKVGYFTQLSIYLNHNWWTPWSRPVSKVGKRELKFLVSVHQLVHLFNEKWKKEYFAQLVL